MAYEQMTFQESIRQLSNPMGKILPILFDELGSCPLCGVRRGTVTSWKKLAYDHLQLQTFGNLWPVACQARCPLRVHMSQSSKTLSFFV